MAQLQVRAPASATSRYEKLAVRYLTTIRIAAIRIAASNEWLPRHL